MKILPKGKREWRLFFLKILFLVVGLCCTVVYSVSMPGQSYTGQLLPLSKEEQEIKDGLIDHVKNLAERIGERNIFKYANLLAAEEYLDKTLEALGYSVNEYPYKVDEIQVKNFEVEIPGTVHPDEIVVIGAHYDSVMGTPGANDNGTGIAALLELAKLLKGQSFPRTLRFVAFTNEEPPFFGTEQMGSAVYAKIVKAREDKIVAMIALETIGFYSDKINTQDYPPGFNLFYPSKGNYIAFVGNLSSRSLVRKSINFFRESTNFPSEGVAAPAWIKGINWSDHSSFWVEGYPALMVTDTAIFRYPQYHTHADTIDKIDFGKTSRVVLGLKKVLINLLGEGCGLSEVSKGWSCEK